MPHKDPEKRRAWYQANRERLIKYSTDWQNANRERVRETARKRYERNPEPKRAASRDFRRANPDRVRAYRRKGKYGLTQEQADAMFESQGRSCACCARTEPGGLGWHVDHNHDTGVVRGILCHYCNTAIGALGDNVEGLMRAVRYLERSNK